MADTRIEAATQKVFERMKAAYLHEGARVGGSGPSFQELSAEYDEALDSDDPRALPEWIAFLGEEAFRRVVNERVKQARRRMVR